MKNIVIEFKNVTKEYKLFENDKKRFLSIFSKRVKYMSKKANDNLTFSITKGESVVIFGRNGAGKSTLLKMITGVVFPTEGSISVIGRVSALLELTAGFDPDFTGRENIFLRGHILGLYNHQIKSIEESIIDFAELGDYIDQPVRTYSSGMKARLGFAINSNINPDILVIDEALSVGDHKFRKKSSNKIKELVNQEHVTVLFVTHNPGSAKDICQRAIVLDKGKMIFDGDIVTATDLYLNQ